MVRRGRRRKVSTDSLEKFRDILESIASHSGFDVKEVNNIEQRVDLLMEALNHEIFDRKNPQKKKKQETADFKKYIKIFENKYLVEMDMEYYKNADATDIKMIKNFVVKLKNDDITIEEYLDWMFSDFYQDPQNATFSPPNLRFTFSAFAFSKYICENKTKVDSKKERAMEIEESKELYTRLRKIIRIAKSEEETKEQIEGYKLFGEDYDGGTYTINQFRGKILVLEKEMEEKYGSQ